MTRSLGVRLIELLVVVAILAVIYEMGMPDSMRFTGF